MCWKKILLVGIVFLFIPCTSWSAFQDKTTQLGLTVYNDITAWADYDNDGWVDLFNAGTLWRNNDGNNFTQVASVDHGVFGDYDNDGYLDTFKSSLKQLFRNAGGTGSFVGQSLPSLPTSVSHGSCWGDWNNDGYIDLYVGGYETWEFPSWPDFTLINNGDGSFHVGWVQTDLTLYNNRARGVASCDWDQDGDLDVYVSNYRLYPNKLWRNNGSGNIGDNDVAGTHNAQAGSGHSIGAAWGDFDNDGLFDLFAGNFAHAGQPQSRFLRNRGEMNDFAFEDMGTCGVWYQESYAVPAAGDYDNDGDLDLFFTTVYDIASFGIENDPVLFRNDGNWTFTNVTSQEGLANLNSTMQAAWADYNNDGDLDLVTGGRLFINMGNSNHWLKVKLIGDGISVNKAAIGAQVRIDVPGLGTLTRQMEGGTGENNQNDLTLHFGLGSYSDPVELEIRWPDGGIQNLTTETDRFISVTKLPGDCTSDGKVDMNDLDLMSDDWLASDGNDYTFATDDPSLVAQYAFENNVNDNTSNNNHGTVVGTTSYGPGAIAFTVIFSETS